MLESPLDSKEIDPVYPKGNQAHSCDRFSGSLDTWIDLHPPILSDPLDTLEEVFGLGQKTSREPRRSKGVAGPADVSI